MIENLNSKRFRNSDKFLLSLEEIQQIEKGKFEVVYCDNQEAVKSHIKSCEGKHIQQVVYSSYHDALTQICFICEKIRTSLKEKEIGEKK